MKKVMYAKFFFIMSLLTTSLITSIRVFYMLEYNITEGQITMLKGIFSIVVTLTELPTGIIADKVSKKMSIAISAILFSLHALIYIVMPNYGGFVLTQIILAVSSSFISGADAGYLHDYIEMETKDQYIDIAGKMDYWGSYLRAAMFLTSGILYSVNKVYNFGLTFILGIFVFIIICTMPDIKREKTDIVHVESVLQEYLNDTLSVLKYTIKNSLVMKITLLSAIVTSLLIFNFEYYQIILNKFLFPEKYIGVLYASFMLMGGIGSKISKRLLDKIETDKIFNLFMLLIAFSYILFAMAKESPIIFVAICIQQICFGSWGLIAQNIILENIPSENVKSTMLSMNSLVTSLLKGAIVIVLGMLLSHKGYQISYIIMFSIMCIVLFMENIITKIGPHIKWKHKIF